MNLDENKVIDVAQVGADGVTILFSDLDNEHEETVTVDPAFLPPRVRVGESLAIVRRATNRVQFTAEAVALFASWRDTTPEDMTERLAHSTGWADSGQTVILSQSHADDIAGLLDLYTRQLPTLLRQAVFVYAQNAAVRAADRLLEGQGVEKTHADRCRLLAMQVGDIERHVQGSPALAAQRVVLQLVAEALELIVALDDSGQRTII